MPSDTHRKRLDLIFVARDNRNLRQSLCERIVRGNLGDKGMRLLLRQLSKQARGTPWAHIIFFAKLKER